MKGPIEVIGFSEKFEILFYDSVVQLLNISFRSLSANLLEFYELSRQNEHVLSTNFCTIANLMPSKGAWSCQISPISRYYVLWMSKNTFQQQIICYSNLAYLLHFSTRGKAPRLRINLVVRYVISGKKASKKRFLLAFTQNNSLWFPGNGSMARRKKLKADTKIAIERS